MPRVPKNERIQPGTPEEKLKNQVILIIAIIAIFFALIYGAATGDWEGTTRWLSK